MDRPLSATAAAVLARFNGAIASVFALDGARLAVLVVVRGMLSSAVTVSSLGSSKLLSKADVAGEHVATEETALRTASAWARGVSMKKGCNGLIQYHIIAVSRTVSKRQQ
jgi:hypothetical protein